MSGTSQDHLVHIYEHICKINPSSNPVENDSLTNEGQENSANCENDDLENFIQQQDLTNQSSLPSTSNFELREKLNGLLNQERVHSKTDILEFWKLKQYSEPELYKIVEVVLAVPATQVSVERSFSALALILTKHRSTMSAENLNDLLIIRLNNDLLNKVTIE